MPFFTQRQKSDIEKGLRTAKKNGRTSEFKVNAIRESASVLLQLQYSNGGIFAKASISDPDTHHLGRKEKTEEFLYGSAAVQQMAAEFTDLLIAADLVNPADREKTIEKNASYFLKKYQSVVDKPRPKKTPTHWNSKSIKWPDEEPSEPAPESEETLLPLPEQFLAPMSDRPPYPLAGEKNAHKNSWKEKEITSTKRPEGNRHYWLTQKPEPKRASNDQVASWLGALTGMDWQHDPETGRIETFDIPEPHQRKALKQLEQDAGVLYAEDKTYDDRSRLTLKKYNLEALREEAIIDEIAELHPPLQVIKGKKEFQGKVVKMPRFVTNSKERS